MRGTHLCPNQYQLLQSFCRAIAKVGLIYSLSASSSWGPDFAFPPLGILTGTKRAVPCHISVVLRPCSQLFATLQMRRKKQSVLSRPVTLRARVTGSSIRRVTIAGPKRYVNARTMGSESVSLLLISERSFVCNSQIKTLTTNTAEVRWGE